jgi:RNA polymerase sigma-70 factor (ECF subfamily)
VRELGERFESVLAEAARGDSAAFAELWRTTHPPLLRYLRVIAGDAAEDVASETWLKAMRGLPSFVGDEPSFRGWLTVIGRNVARDLGRYTARRPETLLADPEPARRVTAPDAADQALERLGTERALRLLATLPPAQADLVALRVIVGLEPAEIALIVGRSAGAVRVTVHRALGTLARTLGEAGDVVDVTTTTQEALTERHG